MPRRAPTASSSSMKMIAGRALRASENSRRMRAAPRPANISTNEAADWEKNWAPDSPRDGLGQQRLARAGRAVQQDALRDLARRAPRTASGSRRNSTTSASSALASSAPATSVPAIEEADSGLICCGLVRGISFIVRQMKNTSRPMKMIGAQVMIQFSISYHGDRFRARHGREYARSSDVPAWGLDPIRPRRGGSRPARRGRPRAGARPARACRSGAGSRSRGAGAARAARVSALRSHQAKTSTAAAVEAIATAPPAIGPGFSTARRSSSVPARLEASIGATRCEPQRSCSFVASARPPRRPRRRRSPCARRRGRRRARRRAARTARA